MNRNPQALRRRLERLSARRVQDEGRDLYVVYAPGPDIETYASREDATEEGMRAILEDYRLIGDQYGRYDRICYHTYRCEDPQCIGPNGEPCEGHKTTVTDVTGNPYGPYPHAPPKYVHVQRLIAEMKRTEERGNG
jgi:hypothetical protein